MSPVEQRLRELENRIAELERARWLRASRSPHAAADDRFGVSWLNGLGAAFVLAGVVAATGWLHDHGYLTPLLRNAMLLAGAIAILVVGVRALRGPSLAQRRFGNGLVGVGALGLYIVVFAACRLDELIGANVAAVIAGALTLALAVAAYRLEIEVLAALSAIGGLAVPSLTVDGAPHAGLLALYLAAYGAGLLWLQHVTRWTSVLAIAAVGSAAYYLVVDLADLRTAAFAAASLAPLALPYVIASARSRAPGLAETFAAIVAATTAAVVCYRAGSLVAAGGVGVVIVALALSVRAPLLAVCGALTVALAAVNAAPASSMTWLCAGLGGALACIAVGLAWGNEPARRAGVVVLGATLVRMLVVDVWTLASGPRVVAFLLLGVGLLAASFLYARAAERHLDAPPASRQAPPTRSGVTSR